jgi:hypothetical protein
MSMFDNLIRDGDQIEVRAVTHAARLARKVRRLAADGGSPPRRSGERLCSFRLLSPVLHRYPYPNASGKREPNEMLEVMCTPAANRRSRAVDKIKLGVTSRVFRTCEEGTHAYCPGW